MATPPDKLCSRCGRHFAWRRKWAGCWDTVRYCSERCRRTRPDPREPDLERSLLELLGRAGNATLCPSQVARAVAPDDWRPLMEPTRVVARRLAADERVEVRQRGRRVDPDRARGAIRIARGRRFGRTD